ncbi:ABC transporter permease subunit [Paroceanicella profunda]|uniref:ABC transporter permease subunit n=1 Tax=Paroceanicella profunda TaxID=2579971 RepID=A0A5B8FZJ7_9RHOB|nr:ABC transporter permease subunit [Paroceanicella profunda]QDL93104.1 ABC transporter permease subunit [Paroceanicella profunda]
MQKLLDYGPLLLSGAVTTVCLAVLSLLLATLLGGWGARAKLIRPQGDALNKGLIRLQARIATIYTTLARGIPDLVLMLILYFGGQRLLNWATGVAGLETLEFSKFLAGTLSIGLLYGAYLTETFRGAWMAVARGQGEAAEALGLRGLRAFWLVLFPQFVRHALPGYGNVWQVLVKSTAVVSVIGLEDLVGLANDVGKSQRDPFLFMLVVIVVYLAITSVSGWGFAWAERRYSRGLR